MPLRIDGASYICTCSTFAFSESSRRNCFKVITRSSSGIKLTMFNCAFLSNSSQPQWRLRHALSHISSSIMGCRLQSFLEYSCWNSIAQGSNLCAFATQRSFFSCYFLIFFLIKRLKHIVCLYFLHLRNGLHIFLLFA